MFFICKLMFLTCMIDCTVADVGSLNKMTIIIRDLRIVFWRSNRISNRIGRPIRFRIEFSNRIGRIYDALYSEYLIHFIGIYFVFVTNESDARN